MADSPYLYDFVSPIMAGARLAGMGQEMGLRERELSLQESRLLNEFRAAQELSKYRAAEQEFRDRQEQRLLEDFQLRQSLAARQANVLQNIEAETARLRGAAEFGPLTPEQERAIELGGMARGYAASGFPKEAVDVVETGSKERIAQARQEQMLSRLQGLQMPQSIKVGGADIIVGPGGRFQENPVSRVQRLRQDAVIRQSLTNVKDDLDKLEGQRAFLLKSGKTDRKTEMELKVLGSIILQRRQERDDLTQKLSSLEPVEPEGAPAVETQPSDPFSGLYDELMSELRGRTVTP